jgi:hypothetical protein
MRKWGIVITALYALILLGLIVPAAVLISGFKGDHWASGILELCQEWLFWIPAAVILAGQALLLFLSVDFPKTPQAPLPHSRFRHRRRAAHRFSFFCGNLVSWFCRSRRQSLG